MFDRIRQTSSSQKMSVDFTKTGKSAAEVLCALWEEASGGVISPIMFVQYQRFKLNSPTIEQAQAAIDRNGGDVDYFSGRPIKVDFSRFPVLNSWLYDRDNGEGAMSSVLSELSE